MPTMSHELSSRHELTKLHECGQSDLHECCQACINLPAIAKSSLRMACLEVIILTNLLLLGNYNKASLKTRIFSRFRPISRDPIGRSGLRIESWQWKWVACTHFIRTPSQSELIAKIFIHCLGNHLHANHCHASHVTQAVKSAWIKPICMNVVRQICMKVVKSA